MPIFMPLATLHMVVAKANVAKTEKRWLAKLLHEPDSTNSTS
jgi:hypothetical protein